MKNKLNLSRGFSLIELMIALTAGLIVIGAVGAFTISSLQANAEYIQATRLNQELRNSLDFTTRELRRAGYDEDAVEFLLKTVTVPSPFVPIFVPNAYSCYNDSPTAGSPTAVTCVPGSPFRGSLNNNCIIYAYDRKDGTSGTLELANAEIRGLRRRQTTVNGVLIGVLEMAESSSGVTPSCTDAAVDYSTYPATCVGAWCALSDPRQLDVTSFDIDVSSSPGSLSTSSNLLIRDVNVSIQGSLPGQPDVVRGVQSSIKIRSDCIRSTTAACESAPAGI